MTQPFDTAMWTSALRPFALLLILWVFGVPITVALQRRMADGKLKRTLLDRTMTDRKPWVSWLAVCHGFGSMILGAWIGLTLNH